MGKQVISYTRSICTDRSTDPLQHKDEIYWCSNFHICKMICEKDHR